MNYLKQILILFLLMYSPVMRKAVAQEGGQLTITLTVDGKLTHDLPTDINFGSSDLVLSNEIIDKLMATGRYRNIVISEERDGLGRKWNVTASSVSRVRSVEISGLQASEEAEYARILRTKAGESYNHLDASFDVYRIKERLKDRGYLKADVTAHIKPLENNDNEVQVVFDIYRGRPCRVSELYIEPGISILNFVTSPIEPGAVCDVPAIKEALERQKAKLSAEGYLSADMRFLGITYSRDKERGVVQLKMDRGPRTRIEVFNQATHKLEDVLSAKTNLSISDLSFFTDEELRAEVLKTFQAKGFSRAIVSGPFRSTASNGDSVVRFEVQPGVQMYIDDFFFRGPMPMSKGDMIDRLEVSRRFISRRILFIESDLPNYQDRLRQVYWEAGYADADVQFPVVGYTADDNYVTVTFNVDAGKKYVLKKLTVIGWPSEMSWDPTILAESAKEGDPLVKAKLQDAKQELRLALLQNGYAYADATVDLVRMQKTKDRIDNEVIFRVVPGPLVRIRKIFAEGELFGKNEAIVKETSLEPGDLYTPENIERARDRLLKHGLFGNVEVTPLDPGALDRRETDIDLIVKARRRGNYSLGIVPGWSSASGYRFLAEYSQNNLTSDGLRLFSSVTVSQENQQKTYANLGQLLGTRVNLGIVEPFFKVGPLVSPVDVSLTGSYGAEVQDLYNRRFGTAAQETQWRPYFLDRSWSFSLKWQFERSWYSNDGLPLIEALEQKNLTIIEGGIGIALDTRDSREWPVHGGVYEASVALARFGLLSEVQFNRYSGDVNFFYPIFRRFSGAISFGTSQISNVVNEKSETVTAPGSRRATLTGPSQVRGFPETTPLGPMLWLDLRDVGSDEHSLLCKPTLTAIGATNVFYLKHEIRFRSPIWSNNIGFAWFVDTGSAFFTETEGDKIQDELTRSVGRTQGNCVVKDAVLVGNDSISKGKPKAITDYFSTSYMSSGIGTRVIIPHFAALSLDWGYPLRDPADKKEGCVTISAAEAGDAAPVCVGRRGEKKIFNFLPGAFHVSIGAAF